MQMEQNDLVLQMVRKAVEIDVTQRFENFLKNPSSDSYAMLREGMLAHQTLRQMSTNELAKTAYKEWPLGEFTQRFAGLALETIKRLNIKDA
jgi:hypothetical protein